MQNVDQVLDEEFEDRPERQLRPVPAGWALDYSAFLDRYRPGFLIEVLRSKPVHRHAIFAALATSRLAYFVERVNGEVADDLEETTFGTAADLLISLSPREVIAAAFDGRCPDGLLGVFARQDRPLEPEDYLALVALMSDGSQRERQRVLRYIPRITPERLRGLQLLDDALLHIQLARHVSREGQAKIANDILHLVRRHRPDLTDTAIREYVGQASADSSFLHQLERMLGLVKEIEPPFQLPADKFVVLTTRRQFEEFGTDHRNCLGSGFFDTHALTGRLAFSVYLPARAIVIFIATESGWLASKVHCPMNRPPPPGLTQEITQALAETGIPFLLPAKMGAEVESVRRVFARYDPWGLDSDCLDGVDSL